MAAAFYDPSGQELIGRAQYEKVKNIKLLYRMYVDLYKKAENGNSTATSIYIDLKEGLNILTNKQKYCIINVLIKGDTMENVSIKLECSINTVSYHITGGLKRIQKALLQGVLYNKQEDKINYILSNYKVHQIKDIASHLGITESYVRVLYSRNKERGVK